MRSQDVDPRLIRLVGTGIFLRGHGTHRAQEHDAFDPLRSPGAKQPRASLASAEEDGEYQHHEPKRNHY